MQGTKGRVTFFSLSASHNGDTSGVMMMLIMMMMMMLCVNVPRGLTMFLWGQVTFRLEDRGEDWGGGGGMQGGEGGCH